MTARAELQSPSRIDSVRIELQHLAVEVLSARRRFREVVEIADVLPSLFKGCWDRRRVPVAYPKRMKRWIIGKGTGGAAPLNAMALTER